MSEPELNRILRQVVLALGRATKREDVESLRAAIRALDGRATRVEKNVSGHAGDPRKKMGEAQFSGERGETKSLATREDLLKHDSREHLAEFLLNNYPKKSDVTALARSLKVPAAKGDDYESVVDRIIDATVGYRLRSQAIRGSK